MVERSAEVLGRLDGLRSLLTGSESRRAAAFQRTCDRGSFVAARLLARTVVADLVGAAAGQVELEQRCPLVGALR